ncbi:MAG: HlyD family efflux transporter periplasmic adaptor subunit [Pseudohongiella sp.]|nr:HlyD family efflux transporter periplasmic adaptor subunit [Pseudohongiella sp.]
MDIIKTPIKTPLWRRFWYAPLLAAALGAALLMGGKYRNVSYLVAEESILIDTVTAGELLVSVRGYGQLSSRDVVWIGAETQGRVSRILAKPGDPVNAGDVLVELVNPQLLQDLRDADLEFSAQRADMRASEVARETGLLDLQAEAASAEIDYQTAKMDLDAKTELLSQGLQVISRLDYERTQLSVQKFRQRWDLQQRRVTQIEQSMQANREAEQARLLQTENELQKIRDLVTNLSVVASVGGIVQEMTLQLGQQVGPDQNITRIARPDQLVADVQIQELQVNDIIIGMPATVDTRTSKIHGKVSRIDPAVVDGSVLVEIELEGPLPQEVRPELNIEANINITSIPDTLSVRRPVFARPNSQSTVYRLNAAGDIAEQVTVRYGAASTNVIEVLEGLGVGDRIIVSDPDSFNTHERILIR